MDDPASESSMIGRAMGFLSRHHWQRALRPKMVCCFGTLQLLGACAHTPGSWASHGLGEGQYCRSAFVDRRGFLRGQTMGVLCLLSLCGLMVRAPQGQLGRTKRFKPASRPERDKMLKTGLWLCQYLMLHCRRLSERFAEYSTPHCGTWQFRLQRHRISLQD